MRIKVLIVDDHPMMLIGIKEFLSIDPHLHIVGTATSGEEALLKTRNLEPHIVVMDISLPGLNGLETTERIRKEIAGVEIIILSMYDDKGYVEQFAASGALGYVLKSDPPDQLVTAIKEVSNGNAFVSPRIAKQMLKVKPEDGGAPLKKLTERQKRILSLIAQGKTTKEIAKDMCMSTRNAARERGIIRKKLNLYSIAELTAFAIAHKS